MRAPARRAKPRIARTKSFPAPVGGWIANQNLAAPDTRLAGGASAPQGAAILENWFPTATGVRMRGGSELFATIGSGTDPVRSMFSFINGTVAKFFGATPSAIYDISSPANPAISPVAAVSGKTGGDWVAVQHSTPGGAFLRLVNGMDDPLVYDGTSFVAPNYADPLTFPITGIADAKKLSFAWKFKSRLFFIEKNSLNAWYLPVDVIAGTAIKFPLGGIFQRGGSLLFGASWSIDQTSGLSAMCVFMTTEGEIAVYQGSDPGSVDDWSLVGLYSTGRPLGQKAFIQAGGDLVIATDNGAIPLSQAASKDAAAIAPFAVSYPIETEWNKEVALRSNGPWACEIWPTRQMVIVAMPSSAYNLPQMFVANSRTGAWCKFTGWDGLSLAVFGKRCFYGTGKGQIVEADVSGLDLGAPFTATYVPLFDDLKTPASLKTTGLARAVLLTPMSVNDRVSVQNDYSITLPPAPDAATAILTSLWGSGVWGESVWGEMRERKIQQEWRSVYGLGYALSVAVQITSGALAPPDVDLVRIDMTFDVGDIVT